MDKSVSETRRVSIMNDFLNYKTASVDQLVKSADLLCWRFGFDCCWMPDYNFSIINPVALRTAKTVLRFDCFECSRVNLPILQKLLKMLGKKCLFLHTVHVLLKI